MSEEKTQNSTDTPDDDSGQESEKELSFLEHLEELRLRLIYCLATIFVTMIVSYFFSAQIIDFLSQKAPPLVTLAPTGAIMARLKIAFFTGFVVSIPMVFYQVWRFIVPGLLKKEKSLIPPLVLFSCIFFLVGGIFANLLLPLFIKFLRAFHPEGVEPTWEVWSYLNFVIKLIIAFGIIFQLPVISYFLTRVGVLDPDFLRKRRRIAVVIIFIIAAVLTPPDIFTQISMVLPLLLLFESSILVSRLASRARRKQKAREMAG
jgi:sec-independent protein translocase protein TatC